MSCYATLPIELHTGCAGSMQYAQSLAAKATLTALALVCMRAAWNVEQLSFTSALCCPVLPCKDSVPVCLENLWRACRWKLCKSWSRQRHEMISGWTTICSLATCSSSTTTPFCMPEGPLMTGRMRRMAAKGIYSEPGSVHPMAGQSSATPVSSSYVLFYSHNGCL